MSNSIRKLFSRYMKVPEPSTAHAKLSASGSERWLGCPGSVRLSQGLPSPENKHSIAGTHAHTLLQFILENEKTWAKLLVSEVSQDFRDFIDHTPEQLESVLKAVTHVRTQFSSLWKRTGIKPTLLIEKRLEFTGVGFGTADIVLYQPFGELHVIDFKNGKYKVEPEDNPQGLYYLNGAADLFGWDFSQAKFTIVQPNAPHKNGPIRTWSTTPKRLEEAGKRFRKGAELTRKLNAPLVINHKYCFFCPARTQCPLHLKQSTEKIMKRFERCQST